MDTSFLVALLRGSSVVQRLGSGHLMPYAQGTQEIEVLFPENAWAYFWGVSTAHLENYLEICLSRRYFFE